ncbi:hypothetical protein F3Y22_tig00005974pilonHSYRG00134 [Hibiscus syriacus]|uniref:RRM domain-containing protein n=1 Tax=Hibiscus syriacus TaxID=106335 RepID=A0A6A3CDJ9_HIBSY|nr:hypothetical protein F3Y22_tig00005974pilonHSYRG00134 [Hibiscus syriacus]
MFHTIFVNNVSKRIHPSSLKEAFKEYGAVSDVYVAFRNRRRLADRTTFAFVRFRSKHAASPRRSSIDSGKLVKRVWKPSFRDSRSFKDALEGRYDGNALNKKWLNATIHVSILDERDRVLNRDAKSVNPNIVLSKNELRWREFCLVGRIKRMYNIEIIHTTFQAEGFDVRVSSWLDLMVVIQFKGSKELSKCWDCRDDWLRSWFDELELFEAYEMRIKRKIWVILKDVPLAVWCNKFFNDLGNMWGSVVSIHEDTTNRVCFEEAKLLLEVQCVSAIPEKCSIIINGRVCYIKIITEVHEEDRGFIDGFSAGGGMIVPAGEGVDSQPRLQDGCGVDAGFEVASMGESFFESQSKRSGIGHLKSRNKQARGLVEDVGDELHEVPTLAIDGPSFQSLDESIRLVDINREQAQIGATQSLSNSSRFLDVLIEEVLVIPGNVNGIRVEAVEVDKPDIPSNPNGVLLATGGNFVKDAGKVSLAQNGRQARRSFKINKKQKKAKGRRENSAKANTQNSVEPSASKKRVIERLSFIVQSVLSWNIRGLGRNVKVSAVNQAIGFSKARVVLIQETKVHSVCVGIERRLKGRFVTDLVYASAEGASGGLISLWDSDAFTVKCHNVFRRIIVLKGVHDISSSMLVFEDFISRCNLVVVPIIGSVFTWFRGGDNTAASRLDRFLIPADFVCLYPNLVQASLHRGLSDHKPILLCERMPKKQYRPFKWFNHWADDPILADKIRKIFGANQDKDFNHMLMLTKYATNDWVEQRRDLNFDSIMILEKKINSLENLCIANPSDEAPQKEIVSVKAKLWEEYRKSEREWLQKSRLKWFREGDKNTKCFHLTAAIRGRRNQISKLKVNNSVFKNQAGIQQVFVSHFRSCYNDVKTIPIKRFDIPFKRLSTATRRWIERPFSEEEVWGLRQGCPLSPFLFNVVGEALSGLFKKAVDLGLCQGVHIGSSRVGAFHIQFADDLILFSEADERNIYNLFRVLRIFEVAASLKLNMQKMKLFGINVEDSRVKGWADSLFCDWGKLPTMYLGLPLGYKINQKLMWNPVLEKVRVRLESWKLRIKKVFGKKIIVAKYNYDPQAILPSGISVRRSNGLWYDIVRPVLSNESDILVDVRCVMGNGSRIDFWSDHWSEVRSLKVAFPRIYGMTIKKQRKIREFGTWVNGVWIWRIELRCGLFSWEISIWNQFNQVINRGVSAVSGFDRLVWLGASNGVYNSKDFCIKMASTGMVQDPI